MKKYLRKASIILETFASHMVWIKFKKEVLNINKDVYLCAVYIPPAASGTNIDKCNYGELWDKLEEFSKI